VAQNLSRISAEVVRIGFSGQAKTVIERN
jgi:hypothetical protein